MEGAHIPKGQTLVELVAQNKLANISVPSLTSAGKHYSVWVVRPQEAVPVPHKVHELFVSCTCADHLYAVRVADQVRSPCLHGAAVVVALSQMAAVVGKEPRRCVKTQVSEPGSKSLESS